MMKELFALTLGILLLLTAFALGVLHYWNTYEPGISELNADVKKLELEVRLQELENEKQRDAIAYNLEKASIEQQQDVQTAEPVKQSLIVALVIKNLLPAWLLLGSAACGLLFAYSRKQSTTQEIAKARQAAYMQSEEHTARVVERVLPIYARLMARHKPVPVLEAVPVEPEALPAIAGPVYLSQCRQDGDFDESAICLGRSIESGGLVQIPFEVMQSLIKNGLQGQGKSAATLLEIYAALYQKYVLRTPLKLHLIDKHYGFDESLSSRLESMLPGILSLFDTTILGPEIEERALRFLQAQIDDGKGRQEQGSQTQEPLDVIVFDEYTETVSQSARGKAIEDAVKTLFNYRKAKKYLSLLLYETTKNRNSARGLSPAKLGASKMCFACAEDEAGRFIGWSCAKAVAGLQKGQCALKLSNIKEVELVQLAIAGPVDFYAFTPFIAPEGRTTLREQHAGVEDAFTPDTVKRYLDAQKDLTQNALAKQADLNKSDLSKWMNRRKLSAEKQDTIVTALRRIIAPGKPGDLIVLEDYRNSPQG